MKIVSSTPEPKIAATALRNGDMVECPDGSAGVLTDVRAFGSSTVAFGAGGPTGGYLWKELKVLTAQQIIDYGLTGVGCNQSDEVQRILRKHKKT